MTVRRQVFDDEVPLLYLRHREAQIQQLIRLLYRAREQLETIADQVAGVAHDGNQTLQGAAEIVDEREYETVRNKIKRSSATAADE